MPTNSSLSDTIHSSRDRVLTEVTEIVAEYSSTLPDEIRDKHRMVEDLGCDSLDLMEIVMEFEEHFDISVPDELAEKAKTVGDMTDGVVQLLNLSE